MKKSGILKKIALVSAFVMLSAPVVLATNRNCDNVYSKDGDPLIFDVECGMRLSDIGKDTDYKATVNAEKVQNIQWIDPNMEIKYDIKTNPQEIKAKNKNGEDISVKLNVIHREKKDVDTDLLDDVVEEGDEDAGVAYHFRWHCPNCEKEIDKNGLAHSDSQEFAIPVFKSALPLTDGCVFTLKDYIVNAEDDGYIVKNVKTIKLVKKKTKTKTTYTTALKNGKTTYLKLNEKNKKISTKALTIPKKGFSQQVTVEITDAIDEVKYYDVNLIILDIKKSDIKKEKKYRYSINWSDSSCSDFGIQLDTYDGSNSLKKDSNINVFNDNFKKLTKRKAKKGTISFSIKKSAMSKKSLAFVYTIKHGKGKKATTCSYKITK